ncbi:hypothetical protein NPX13_g4843 [Xylaria arbuscula]|uniref:Nephrocystin 3-like N-terminal domain-containing protein n=1 Tax=Xylaria arbuscula TaxID=114810 RepID=A0A9W8TLU6_9PEZI|nr:hypothetical protein NPX13_g4843 [Xylaria arbuscula]
MSPLQDRIRSVGLHVLYEPEKLESTLVDIVFIHGFGGHPMRSWQCDDREPPPTRITVFPPSRGGHLKQLLRTGRSSDQSDQLHIPPIVSQNGSQHWPEANELSQIFWPRDLLPRVCPEARIVTWGYHSLHSGNMPVAAQPDIFARVNELLRDLGDLRKNGGAQQRPLIFIAHSVGGVILKEALREAKFGNTEHQREILSSTAAVVFFGCPHRAVRGVSLVDIVVSMAEATLNIKTERSALTGLCGVHNPRWREARESFVQLWHHFNFEVKTYQERPGGPNKLNTSRVESSKIGDEREWAESLPGGHRTMCQFRSTNDVGFRSLSRFLRGIIKNEKLKRQGLSVDEIHCLRRLDSPRIHDSQRHTTGRYLGTCRAICNSKTFRNWYRRKGGSNEHVLWLTGAPGFGKSTQLRHIKHQMEKDWGPSTTSIVYYFAGGPDNHGVSVPELRLGRTRSIKVIRSILSQLFTTRPRPSFFFDDYIINKPRMLTRRTFILVDAEDSCDDEQIRELLFCLCELAKNSNFSICLASRPIEGHVATNIDQVRLEDYNYEDIVRSVQTRVGSTWGDCATTAHKIAEKAGACFLWAQLATNLLQDILDDGAAQELVDKILGALPTDLYGLYELTLAALSQKEKLDAMTIMRWVILSPEPMLLSDLQMAVRLGRSRFLLCRDLETALHVGSPRSMQELQKKGKQFDTPSQFYQWLGSRTRGLLNARPVDDEGKAQQSLGLQRVYPIHESVRSFFLSGRGFAALSSGRTKMNATREAAHACHYSLLRTVLMYLNTSDLSPLVSRNLWHEPTQNITSSQTSPTWRRNVVDQRNLITSSYPFLRYAVENLLYHLLSPPQARYFLPATGPVQHAHGQ